MSPPHQPPGLMPLFHRTLPALALLGALTLTACDTAEPVDPGPQTANVTLDILSASAAGDCDNNDTPGDYQIQVGALDAGNNVIASQTLPLGTTEYGVWPGGGGPFVLLSAGQTATFDTNLAFQRALDASGSFSAFASVIEYDAAGAMDPRMSDLTETRSHAYTAGQFADIAGTKSLRVRGDDACDVTIQYRISVQ